MNVKQLLWWLLLLFGEAILIAAFIFFRGETADNIFYMNIAVSTVVYGLIFLNYRAPWIDLDDKSQKKIGGLGINWLFTWIYVVLAIAAMLCTNVFYTFAFTTQLIIHCILLFILLLGMWASLHASDKVKEVYQQETTNRKGINEMKTAMQHLKDKMSDADGLSESFTRRINSLEEGLRYISPSNNDEAYSLEHSFANAVNDISFAVFNFSTNEEAIENNLKKLERIYQNRKNIYSN
ncbi:MAG: hypothetical protein LBV41_09795 [Cytophagaceae bacterium]|jgi:hypothetical protein|nr:hypothetical protein [Cytophagaceae bacterium]